MADLTNAIHFIGRKLLKKTYQLKEHFMIRIRNLEEFINLSGQGGEALNASELVAFMKNRNMTIDLNLACKNGNRPLENLSLGKPTDSVK